MCYMVPDGPHNTRCKLEVFQDAGIGRFSTKMCRDRTSRAAESTSACNMVEADSLAQQLCCQCCRKAENVMQ